MSGHHAVLSVVGPDRPGALFHALRYLCVGPQSIDLAAAARVAEQELDGAIPLTELADISSVWVRVVQPMGMIMLRFSVDSRDTLEWLSNKGCLDLLAAEINSTPSKFIDGPMAVTIHDAPPPSLDRRYWVITVQIADRNARADGEDFVVGQFVECLRAVIQQRMDGKFTDVDIHSIDYLHYPGGLCELVIRAQFAPLSPMSAADEQRELEQLVAAAGREAFGNRLLPPTGRTRVGKAPDAIPYLRNVIRQTTMEARIRGEFAIAPIHTRNVPRDVIEALFRCMPEMGQKPILRGVARSLGRDVVGVVAARANGEAFNRHRVKRWCDENVPEEYRDGRSADDRWPNRFAISELSRVSQFAPLPGPHPTAPFSVLYRSPRTRPGRLLRILEMMRKLLSPKINIMSADGLWTGQRRGARGFSGQITFGLPHRTLRRSLVQQIASDVKKWLRASIDADCKEGGVDAAQSGCEIHYEADDFAE